MYPIEKDIPLPDDNLGKGGRPKIYPIDDLEVGESFFVPMAKTSDLTSVVAYRAHKRRWERRFTVRQEKGGARCWRIA